MNYTKPELSVLDSAIDVIQGTGDSKNEAVLDAGPIKTSASAYEADE